MNVLEIISGEKGKETSIYRNVYLLVRSSFLLFTDTHIYLLMYSILDCVTIRADLL